MSNIDKVLKERGNNYGAFEGHADITQRLKAIVREQEHKLNPTQREALDMIMHKVGRILNGNPDYKDSWVDIAGYAQLVVQNLEEKEKIVTQPSLFPEEGEEHY